MTEREEVPAGAPLPRESAGSGGLAWTLLALAAYVLMAIAFFDFVVDDAFISARYGENWVDLGALVFNPGERITAMTSPLHAIVLGLLYAVTGLPSVSVYRSLMVVAVPVAMVFGAYRMMEHPAQRSAFLLLTLASPATVLWTVGGLETPMLLVAVTLLVWLAASTADGAVPPRRFLAAVLLAGLAFCIRFDSVVFTAWPCLYLLTRARGHGRRALLLVAGAALPLAWLTLSWWYYGDPLPTSFYVKGTDVSVKTLAQGGIYALYYVVVSGLAPTALVLALGHLDMGSAARVVRKYWWLVSGAVSFLLYALYGGAVHMMFAYRLYVPFTPVFALLLLRLAGARPRAWLLGGLAALQIFVAGFMYVRALNPTPASMLRALGVENRLSRLGFQNSGLSVPEYRSQELRTWEELAEEAARDWRVHGDRDRRARIETFVGGYLPYLFREADAWDELISYRHECKADLRPSVDYVLLGFPPDASGPERRASAPRVVDTWRLVSRRVARIDDGRSLAFELFANPGPVLPFPLPPTVWGACVDAEPTA